MGQANSRGRSNSTTATPSTSLPTINDNEPERPNSKPPSRSRRSAVRTTILNLVKRRSSIVNNNPDIGRSLPDNNNIVSSQPTSNSRRRWRSSRRWSTVPERSAPNPIVSEAVSAPSEPPSTSIPNNGKDREHDDQMASETPSSGSQLASTDRPSTPFPPSSSTSTIAIVDTDGPSLSSDTISPEASGIALSQEEQTTSQNIGSWLGNQGQGQSSPASLPRRLGVASTSHEEDSEEEVVISPDTFGAEPITTPDAPADTPPSEPSPASTQPAAAVAAAPTPSRQFPPPGTLVVVQGVVHTTDVARRPISDNNSVSRPSPAGATTTPTSVPAARSTATPSVSTAGSNVQPRPSSSASGERVGSNGRNRLSALIPRSRPASMLSVAPSGADDTPTSDSSNSDVSPPAESENGNSAGSSTPATTVSSPAENDTRNGNTGVAISSSSIDVLGTLLSVAAAATAASLLTGSSEPIFTSGLAPPGAAHVTTSAAHPNAFAGRPMSPTPTAGLGGLGFGLGDTDPELPVPGTEPGARGRDRMRHAWGNLRERLGLPVSRPTNVTAPVSPEAGRPMDAREVMLAEMARAFNLGLGLGGISPTVATAEESGRQGDGGAGDRSGAGGGEEGAGRTLPPEDSFERFLIDLQADLRVALSHPGNDGEQEQDGTRTANAEPADVAALPSTTDQAGSSPADAHIQVTPDSVLPGARPDDSGNEFDIEGARNLDVPSFIPVEAQAEPEMLPRYTHTPLGRAASTPSSSSRTERRPGGGINWWRLYRFPPINAPPQAQGAANNARPASFPFSSSSPAAGVAPPTPDSTSESTPSVAPTTTATVIPVIVVGLQSVNMNRGQRTGEGEGAGGDEGDGGLEDDVDMNGFPNPLDHEMGQGAQRERRWHSRAADAIRNLRPGRRGVTREAQSGEAAASRTFLIYVIGGYYPPDHHIVTGANTLDSFEALWELAELLGQVKPPTATKEDIEKSGLEIIKPRQLVQFEKAGKISANCVERCLICLDDYEAEDDVRVLTCRHAFHKSCVDKWLQTGRNNCPACRSRGVSTDSSM